MKDLVIQLALNSNPSIIQYFVYKDNTFIASIAVNTNDNSYLDELFIEKAYRRKGFGKYLLEYFKIRKLDCTTWNTVGISFYTALGFKVLKRDNYLVTFVKE